MEEFVQVPGTSPPSEFNLPLHETAVWAGPEGIGDSRFDDVPEPHAVEEVAAASQRLLDSLVTQAPPKNRETEAEKARARAAKRYVAA